MVISLYELTLKAASESCDKIKNGIFSRLSAATLCDLLYEVAKLGKIQSVQNEVLNLDTFISLLVGSGQSLNNLRFVFKVIIQEFYIKLEGADVTFDDLGTRCGQPAQVLVSAFLQRCRKMNTQDIKLKYILIRNGKLLGNFLYDSGWYYESASVFRQVLYLAMENNDAEALIASLSCCEKLLSAQRHYYMYNEGKVTYLTAQAILKKLENLHIDLNLASLYCAFSAFEYMSCSFNKAVQWSVMALQQLRIQTVRNIPVEIEVLRRASLCCAIKREADKGRSLIMEALHLASTQFGPKSVIYADTLLDLGDFMIKTDSAAAAVAAFQAGLEMHEIAYGKYNLKTAVAYEDLAYGLYVHEYSSGNFNGAKCNAETSIEIMSMILPPKHLQLASSKRVVALIQEEVAIESVGTDLEPIFLNKAEEFHSFALKLSIEVFGEMCVHTAKHYGNLGRLYQTMKKYHDAEAMHLKSIAIKEELLGKWDYEVSLSMGHLASLYNYDMGLYEKAEPLHIRSVEIGEKLFGKTYSGLEYEYRGLLRIYTRNGNREKVALYVGKLNEWKFLRELRSRLNLERDAKYDSVRPLNEVLDEFFSLKWLHTEIEPLEVHKEASLEIAVE